jgi:outer membrane protein OmpA-like peptidoglycan-associated protein
VRNRLCWLAVLACSTVACSSGEGSPGAGNPASGQAKAPGTSQSQWIMSPIPTRVDVLALDRTSGKAVTLRLRFTNFGQDRQQISQFTDLGLGLGLFEHETGPTGVTLVADRMRYYPWFEKDAGCSCTKEGALGAYLEPGETFEYFVNFPVPRARKVTLFVPNTPPFINVPISDRPGPVTPPPGQEEHDPAKAVLAEPRIEPLLEETQELDGTSERTEDDKRVEVRLAADVLFAFNKAELSPRARSVLQKVAAQINASHATVVAIDGYTDDTGDDAVNVPLSERRAAAVQRALKPLVTKPGITYTTAGHGSDDPVVSNTSPQNRRRNRRVSVTFAR